MDNQNTQSSTSSPQSKSGQTQDFAPLPDEKQAGGSGVPLAKIATKQIAISKEDLQKFDISEDYVKQNPALVDLILKTESMKDEERKYWFQLLPIMSEEQVKKLQGILQNEKDQLAELDAKYEEEVKKLNTDKPTWDPNLYKEKRQELEQKEEVEESEEKEDEADILNQLENL